jgi:FkbM family methyltransferase
MLGRRLLRRLLPAPLALALRRDWLVRRVLSGRGAEGEVQLLPKYVGPAHVCWDIGANAGMYTLPLARLAAQVIAFEPIPHNFEILELVKARGRLDNVTLRHEAIADAAGPARMAIPTEGFYGGFYVAALDDGGDVAVAKASIDGLIASGVPSPDFIKCDVEGAETQVIDGARALIAGRHPIWLLETFEDHVVPLMISLGYAAYVHVGGGRVEAVAARDARHRNYLFAPRPL